MQRSSYNDPLAHALFTPHPAVLPGIGLSIPLEQALNWLAFGRPSNDIYVWVNDVGEVKYTDSEGNVVTSDGHLMAMTAYLDANRMLHEAPRDASLPAAAYVWLENLPLVTALPDMSAASTLRLDAHLKALR